MSVTLKFLRVANKLEDNRFVHRVVPGGGSWFLARLMVFAATLLGFSLASVPTPSLADIQNLPDKCDELPSRFEPLPRDVDVTWSSRIRLDRERIAAADAIHNQRAALEARLIFMRDKVEARAPHHELLNRQQIGEILRAGAPDTELLTVARSIAPELIMRAERDVADGKFDSECKWVQPEQADIYLQIIAAMGTEEEKARQLGVLIRHLGFLIDFGTDPLGAVDNALPVIAARYTDFDAYRDALAIAGTQGEFKDRGKGTAFASYAARTIAYSYGQISGHSTAVALYRDALSFLRGKEEEDPEYTSGLLLDLATVEWRYGTSANAEAVIHRAYDFTQGHRGGISGSTEVALLKINAEIAYARLDDAQARQLFGLVVNRAMSEPRDGPDGNESLAHKAARSLVERYMHHVFCVDCGEPEAAVRWLKRFEILTPPTLPGNNEPISELSPSEFSLLYQLPPDRMTTASWNAAVVDLSRGISDWRKLSMMAKRWLGSKANTRAVAQLIALYLAAGSEGGFQNFLKFLLEKDVNRSKSAWLRYFKPVVENTYENFGADTDLIEDLYGIGLNLIDAGYVLPGRTVFEYLVDRASEHGDTADAESNAEDRLIAFSPILVPVHVVLASLAAEAENFAETTRHLDEGERLARLRLTREWRVGNERAGAVLQELRPGLRSIAELRVKLETDAAARRFLENGPARAFEALQLALLGDVAISTQAAQRRRILSDHDLAAAIVTRDEANDTAESADIFRRTAGALLPRRLEDAHDTALSEAKKAEAFIQKALPAPEDVASLMPLSLAETSRLLRADEILLVLHAGNKGVYGTLVRNTGDTSSWITGVPLEEVERQISTLREGLDVKSGELPRFHFDTAVSLFEMLLGPARGALSSHRRLLVVSDGPLLSLPLGVLLPEKPAMLPTTVDEFRTITLGWLARTQAIIRLPNVKALQLRGQPHLSSGAKKFFAGIGNPRLAGPPGDKRRTDYFDLFNGTTLADVNAIRALPALPETEKELRSLANSFHASNHDLLLGEAATETAVKNRDLSNYQIVAFATHALVGGGPGVTSEPGLILTPPAKATEIDDGFLTASEIETLRFDADLVMTLI